MPRKVELDLLVPGDPEEVADRIKGQTRWSPQPFRGGPFTLGDKPMKGRVSGESSNVGLNKRDWWSLYQPTVNATLEPAATGTRIRGTVGMPDWLVWLLRAVVVLGIPGAVGVAALALLPAGQTAILALFVAAAVVMSVLGIGAHVHHADEQVDDLAARLMDASGASAPITASEPSAELTEATREAEPAGARRRQTEG